MNEPRESAPDSTAARVALWRALHVELDAPPHVLADEVGLQLLAPEPGWQQRGDMDPQFTRPFRASIVARARFIEDLVVEQARAREPVRDPRRGPRQLRAASAGDGVARDRVRSRPARAAGWKQRRLIELGFGVPDWLRFVPVDFEAKQSWRAALVGAGFDAGKPAVVVSTGVSMYLTHEANAAALREVASLAPGPTLAMTFLLPLEHADPDVRPGLEMAAKGARQRHAVHQLLHAGADPGARA